MSAPLRFQLLVLLIAPLAAGCQVTCEEVFEALGPHEEAGGSTTVTVAGVDFVRWTIDPGACGPAFVDPQDIDQDGRLDLVVSKLGKRGTVPRGEVTIYSRDGDSLSSWSRTPVVTPDHDLRFTAKTGTADIDGDGDLDLAVPAGFFVCSVVPGMKDCGALGWFENEGDSFVHHPFGDQEQADFFHAALLEDLDGDGAVDLVTVAEQDEYTAGDGGRAEVQLYRGTGSGFVGTPEVLAEGLGTIPRLGDVDGDGDTDIYGGEFFRTGGSFAWVEQVEAPDAESPGAWSRHVIDDEVGPSIDLELVPDLLGDDRVFAVGSSHTNPAQEEEHPEAGVYLYERPDDPSARWPRTSLADGIVSEDRRGQFAPGVLGIGDVDGDGDVDLLVSGDGDARVFLFEQTDGGFVQHVLEEELSQAGGMLIVDLDGDGANELVVTGYEDDVIYIYERD
jgi:hypothetical protein